MSLNKYYVGNGFIKLGKSPNIFIKIGENILQIKVSDIELTGNRVMVDVYSYKKSAFMRKNAKEFISFMKKLNPIGAFSPVNNLATLKDGRMVKCYSFFGRTFIYNKKELEENMRKYITTKQNKARKYYLALLNSVKRSEN